jgi:hypothetical protein
VDDGILLSGTNSLFWSIFKKIKQKASSEPSQDTHDEILQLVEDGFKILETEAL